MKWSISKQSRPRTFAKAQRRAAAANARHPASQLARPAAVLLTSSAKAQINNLNAKLNEKEQQLNARLTDDEKNARASQEQAKRIEELEKQLKENTISGNKNVVNSVLQGSRDILGIQATDNDFTSFVDNITTEDSEKTNKIANYISKIIKDSYEKGKQDATKDAMGNFGNHKGQNSDGKGGSEISNLGKRLADAKKGNQETYDYFK